MKHDETLGRPPSSKPESAPVPSEAELSRIAREAVRQPADPRLDSAMARMGLMDGPASSEPAASQARSRPVVVGPELERLERRLERVERTLWVLVGITGLVAVLTVVLLVR